MDNKQLELVKKIGADPQGYAMVKLNSNALKALVADGYVETNEAMKHGLDIAARLTQKGYEAYSNTGAAVTQEQPAMTSTASGAIIGAAVTNFIPPAKPERAPRSRKPSPIVTQLEALDMGASWFFPANAEAKHPNRATKLAMRSIARTGPKRFAAFEVEAGKSYGGYSAPADGVVVTRTEDGDGPAEVKPRRKKAEEAA